MFWINQEIKGIRQTGIINRTRFIVQYVFKQFLKKISVIRLKM